MGVILFTIGAIGACAGAFQIAKLFAQGRLYKRPRFRVIRRGDVYKAQERHWWGWEDRGQEVRSQSEAMRWLDCLVRADDEVRAFRQQRRTEARTPWKTIKEVW